MKIPLRYQMTEYDCGTTSILNAVTYLYEREEIPPILVYNINKYTIDEFNEKGEENKGGTSTDAVRLLARWINSFSRSRNADIKCEILDGEDVDIYNKKVKKCVSSGGVIVARVWHGEGEHYVIITKLDDEHAYVFDPYYVEITEYDNDDDVEIIKYRKLEYNRSVTLKRISSGTEKDYSLVTNENRQLLLMNRVLEKKLYK